MPANIPAIIYTETITLLTRIPDACAASSFPPTAYTYRPNVVLFNRNKDIRNTSSNIITGKGIPNILKVLIELNDDYKQEIGIPPLITIATPLAIVIILNLTMNVTTKA